MRLRILSLKFVEQRRRWVSWVLSFATLCLALAFGAPARSQAPPLPAPSLAEAARNARQEQSNSTKQQKIITNDDVELQPLLSRASAIPPEASSKKEAKAPLPGKAGCDNSDAERITAEMRATQEERDQIRSALAYQPKIISDGDVDMQNFKAGSSGIDAEATPLSQTEPVAPARVTEVKLDQKIASLKDALRIACGSPADAGTQRKLDSAEQQLKLLQQEFALDQAVYYSKPNYSEDTAGKDKLDAEQQQIESLQAEIERLKSELPAPKTN
jgi:hypothetical protein